MDNYPEEKYDKEWAEQFLRKLSHLREDARSTHTLIKGRIAAKKERVGVLDDALEKEIKSEFVTLGCVSVVIETLNEATRSLKVVIGENVVYSKDVLASRAEARYQEEEAEAEMEKDLALL